MRAGWTAASWAEQMAALMVVLWAGPSAERKAISLVVRMGRTKAVPLAAVRAMQLAAQLVGEWAIMKGESLVGKLGKL